LTAFKTSFSLTNGTTEIDTARVTAFLLDVAASEDTRYACLARPTSTAGLTCFGTTLKAKLAILVLEVPTLVALAKKVPPVLETLAKKVPPVLETLAKKSLGFGDEVVIELVFKVEVVELRMRNEDEE
jgi:hypothetical protein